MFEAKVKSFISKINYLNDENNILSKLTENTFLHLFNMNEAYANSTLDALLAIVDNSDFSIECSEKTQFMINFGERRILISILKDDNEFVLIHEFEHIIHYYGARQYDPLFIKKLLNDINTDGFIKKVKSIINSNLLPIIDKCIKLDSLSENKYESDILLSVDDSNIEKHMIEEGYDSEMIEFVLNSKVSFEEYIRLLYEEDAKQNAYKIMERLYPSYFYFYGLINNIMRGRIADILPNDTFTYGHPSQYFEQNDDIMWFSEIIATYEEIRATNDVETINQLLNEVLGEELYYRLIAYSKHHRELTIKNFNKEKRNVK